MNKLIDFLIMGAQKSGTTALAEFLNEHSAIQLSSKKELHFFDRDRHFKNNPVNYDWYHNYFDMNRNDQLLGEATPIYMYWKLAPKRIFEYNPNMKLIFILRNPIERAYSHWLMETKKGRENMLFERALRLEWLRRRYHYPKQDRIHSYVDRGFYSKQIQNIMRYFPKEQMFFIKNEALLNQHDQVLQSICDFLDIPVFEKLPKQRIIFSSQVNTIPVSAKKKLKKKYFLEIKNLEALLGWDCTAWLKEE